MTTEPQDSDDMTPRPHRNPTKATGPTFAAPEEPVVDLAPEILKRLQRSPSERITCRRIRGDLYRCNWWAPQETSTYDNPTMAGLMVTTHRVRRSQMLHVVRGEEGLVIKPVPDPVSR